MKKVISYKLLVLSQKLKKALVLSRLPTTNYQLSTNFGFTLIETTVAIFAFAIIMVGMVAMLAGIMSTSNRQSGLLSDQDQSRRLAFGIVNELRNAQTAQNGAYALETAQESEIVFYSNIDKDSGVERVRYFVQNNKLYRGIVEYNGNSYPTSTETSVMVQNNLANGFVTPVFYYYDDTYTGSSTQNSLSQPVSSTAVKHVKINLQVFNTAGVKNNNFFTISAGGTIRNLKTNLGN